MEIKNPERRGLRKGVYLIPSVFTAANIGMGFYAVMAAVRAFQFVGSGTQADLVQASGYLDNAAKAMIVRNPFAGFADQLKLITRSERNAAIARNVLSLKKPQPATCNLADPNTRIPTSVMGDKKAKVLGLTSPAAAVTRIIHPVTAPIN